ncbi:Metal dependent phosphohydrolase [Bosea sp. LC85]|uniref:hypothetical protein n=1 Tax=Bosea sp. LC85 TaxID=1502851 RepID=UPI0004E31CD0|nr:hypothetical protein [Bosea sp. LC85]KFC64007.1 Metal dependent phosphohydrolase [Bosea sp. LC85]
MTWLQTASGRAFDLLRPDWRQVDFQVDVPEALARIARFTGHVSSGPYSVAQHCALGADAVFHATKDRAAAAAFLLHDAHEAYLGDVATPIAQALVERVRFFEGHILGDIVTKAQKSLKGTLDKAIYFAAAGWGEGCPPAYREIVRIYDIRMLAAEQAQLLGRCSKPWPSLEGVEPARIAGKLTVWPWPKAADEYRERLRRYLPERFGAGPSPSPRPSRTGARRILTEA